MFVAPQPLSQPKPPGLHSELTAQGPLSTAPDSWPWLDNGMGTGDLSEAGVLHKIYWGMGVYSSISTHFHP